MRKYLLIFFLLISCSSSNGNDPDQPPTPSDPYCNELKDLPYRGISTLHCNLDQARPNCEMIDESLLRSCIKNISINYLVNGTFSFNPSHMNHDLKLLSSNGRHLEVTFYLLNGPGQRRYNSTQDSSFEVRISPESFRQRIKNQDPNIKAAYEHNVDRLIQTIDSLLLSNHKVRIVPMLEDNLDVGSFNQLLSWTKQRLPGRNVMYGRNPCSCYSGADSSIPPNTYIELHASNGYVSSVNGLVTNDGDGFNFPGDNDPYSRITSTDSLLQTMYSANHLGNSFILWHHANQGLSSNALPPPSGRHYKQLGQKHMDFYRDFLRK